MTNQIRREFWARFGAGVATLTLSALIGGDFHLAASSPAVDAATAHPGLPWDADGYPRQVDLPDRPNGLGVADLGAFERQSSDSIFANGFE